MKGSVWLYIYSVYTRDKSTKTESRRSLIFRTVPNERDGGFTSRHEKEQSSSGGVHVDSNLSEWKPGWSRKSAREKLICKREKRINRFSPQLSSREANLALKQVM